MGYMHTVVGGVPQPGFMREACLAEARRDFALRPSDIVIATYPKCGTTWMQQIVLTLLFGGDRSKAPRPLVQAPWIESTICRKHLGIGKTYMGEPRSGKELVDWDGDERGLPAPPRRAFKTHAPVELVPWKGGLAGCGGAKVIVVTRNPKDACVSMFHHSKDVDKFQYRGDLQHFARSLYLPGKVESGCFWAWHAGWERAADEHPESIIWVSYEELKRDFAGTVRRLSDFLEIPATGDMIARTQGASSFAAMKDQFAKVDKALSEEGVASKKNHIRKGEMGSWRGDIDGALLAEFDAVHRAKVAVTGLRYEFDYGDACS